jgi:cytochrome c5
MKKILFASTVLVFIYGCSKKMAPTNTTKAESSSPTLQSSVKVSAPTPVVKDVVTPTPEVPKEVVKEVSKESTIVAIGKETYKAKCGKCHNLKEPQEYNALKWAKIVDWMGPRAKLDAEEKENVLAYVSFYAKK